MKNGWQLVFVTLLGTSLFGLAATAEDLVATPPAVHNEGGYAAADGGGFVLQSDWGVKHAYLLLNNTGRPAIYPSPRKKKNGECNALSTMTLDEAHSLWGVVSVEPGIYSAQFRVWNCAGKWEEVRLDLTFADDHCSRFRVIAPMVLISEWLRADQIPDNLLSTKSLSSPPDKPYLTLPVEVRCVEGPRDTSQCGLFDPL